MAQQTQLLSQKSARIKARALLMEKIQKHKLLLNAASVTEFIEGGKKTLIKLDKNEPQGTNL